LDDLFAHLLEFSPNLRGRLKEARRTSAWFVSPLPRFPVSYDWPEGVIPLGNSAAALEPIGGEGMGLALRSAELASEWLVAHGAAMPRASQELLRRFSRLWSPRRVACRAAAVILSSRYSDIGIELLRSSASLARALPRLTGTTSFR
jgi:2-polyprenyl-6-methoxyphenol hydroxylase-like FAD-dependent oxidoreductase